MKVASSPQRDCEEKIAAKNSETSEQITERITLLTRPMRVRKSMKMAVAPDPRNATAENRCQYHVAKRPGTKRSAISQEPTAIAKGAANTAANLAKVNSRWDPDISCTRLGCTG